MWGDGSAKARGGKLAVPARVRWDRRYRSGTRPSGRITGTVTDGMDDYFDVSGFVKDQIRVGRRCHAPDSGIVCPRSDVG
jgi:hypothetical protein